MIGSFTTTVLFLGPLELGIGLLIVVLLFGAKKIPKLARSSGMAIGEFKKGREEMEDEIQEEQSSGNSSISGPTPQDSDREVETENNK